MSKYGKSKKITKEQRIKRREERRTAKQALKTQEPERVKAIAKSIEDPKVRKHLEAAATRIIHASVEQRIAAAARAKGFKLDYVDPRVKAEAAQQRALALSRARLCRRGRHVFYISSYTEEEKDQDGNVTKPSKPIVEHTRYDTINLAKKAVRRIGIGVHIPENGQLPSQFK